MSATEHTSGPWEINDRRGASLKNVQVISELIGFHDHTINMGWHECEGIPGGCSVAAATEKARCA
jgi:hypothetical protein